MTPIEPSCRQRWGISLRGENFDLLDWADSLHPPFDPWVEVIDIRGTSETVLFSDQFATAADAAEVRDRVERILDVLNGALAIRSRARPVQVKNVVEFGDGEPKLHAFARGEMFDVRCRVSAVVMTLTRDGKAVPPPPPAPSAPQSWLAYSAQSDHVADLLTYAARADNWFDVYKMIEACRTLVGGEAKLIKLCGTDIKEASKRANKARHHRVSYEPAPLTLDETRAFAFHAAQVVLDHIGATANETPRTLREDKPGSPTPIKE